MPSAYDNTILGETGLVRYYPLNEAAGSTTFADLKSSQNGSLGNGTVTFGAASLLPADNETAATFPGTADLAIPAAGLPADNTDYAVEFWTKISSQVAYECFTSWRPNPNTSGQGPELEVSNTNAWQFGDASANLISTVATATNTVYHVVMNHVTSSNTFTLYINGVQKATYTGGSNASWTPALAKIGNYASSGSPTSTAYALHGVMQKVAIYSVALTQTQVTNHYNAGTTLPAQVTFSGQGTLAVNPPAKTLWGLQPNPSYRWWHYPNYANPDSWWAYLPNVSDGKDPVTSMIPRELDLMVAAGAQCVRFEVPWLLVEPSKGVYDWRRMDAIAAHLAKRELCGVPIFIFTPPWANANADPTYSPTNTQDYADFCTAFFKRYKGQFKYVCNWNEPDGTHYWNDTMAHLVALLTAGYNAIKAVDPGVEVIVAPSSGGYSTWAQSFFSAGGSSAFDVWGFSNYNGASTIQTDINNWQSLLNSNGLGSRPMWVTELGAGTQQAGDIDTLVKDIPNITGVTAIIWYNLRDDLIYVGPGIDGTMPGVSTTNTYGLLTQTLGRKSPDAYADYTSGAHAASNVPATYSAQDALGVMSVSGQVSPGQVVLPDQGTLTVSAASSVQVLLHDAVSSQDTLTKLPAHLVLDLLSATDAWSLLQTVHAWTRQLSDATSALDVVQKFASHVLTETTSNQEQTVKAVAHWLRDFISLTDSLAKLPAHAYVQQVADWFSATTSTSAAKTNQQNWVQTLGDATSALDVVLKLPTKWLSEHISELDALSRLWTAHLVLTDLFSSPDLVGKQATKPLQDSQAAQDFIQQLAGQLLFLADQFSETDQVRKLPLKALAEAINSHDALTRQMAKTVLDTVTFEDRLTAGRALLLALQDYLASTDAWTTLHSFPTGVYHLGLVLGSISHLLDLNVSLVTPLVQLTPSIL